MYARHTLMYGLANQTPFGSWDAWTQPSVHVYIWVLQVYIQPLLESNSTPRAVFQKENSYVPKTLAWMDSATCSIYVTIHAVIYMNYFIYILYTGIGNKTPQYIYMDPPRKLQWTLIKTLSLEPIRTSKLSWWLGAHGSILSQNHYQYSMKGLISFSIP